MLPFQEYAINAQHIRGVTYKKQNYLKADAGNHQILSVLIVLFRPSRDSHRFRKGG
jgi:hypothetical protein